MANNKLNPRMTPSPGIDPAHIGGRRALSPLRLPCSRKKIFFKGRLFNAVRLLERDVYYTEIAIAMSGGWVLNGSDWAFARGTRAVIGSFTVYLKITMQLFIVIILSLQSRRREEIRVLTFRALTQPFDRANAKD